MKITHNQLVKLIQECMMEVEHETLEHPRMQPRVMKFLKQHVHPEMSTRSHDHQKGRMLDYGHQMSDSQEGRMAKSNLHNIALMAAEMRDMLYDDDDLPEWLQEKLATVKDRLQSCHSYLRYELENYDENDEQ